MTVAAAGDNDDWHECLSGSPDSIEIRYVTVVH